MSTKRATERDDEVAEGAMAFILDRSITDLVALDDLVTAEHGWRKSAGLVAEGNFREASKDNPVTLWVLRNDADTNSVKRAISAYTHPERDTSLDDLVTKLDSGEEDLTKEEIRTALQALLRSTR